MLTRRKLFKLLGLGAAAPLVGSTAPERGEREVELATVTVAGFQYYDGMKTDATVAFLKEGDELVLRREPRNPHDAQAIEVYTQEGAKLGYLPRSHNEVPARLMDQGVALGARVKHWAPGGVPWECLDVTVYQQLLDARNG